MHWNSIENQRIMPWKGEKDPYKIWLSEIILQQTRVEQGTAYFNRFVSRFPDVRRLAAADDRTVYKLWEGLGYYSRCKNLLATARHIAGPLKGKFPDTYPEILSLKGVGTYTAAAIASFAYNLPHAVVDGNVYRVIARYFGISQPSDSTAGKKLFATYAAELLDSKNPGLYNQAIMDFGATVCKPRQPLCSTCVLRKSCFAFREGMVDALPVKGKKLKLRERHFLYLILSYKGRLFMHRRTAGDIWENLYEFTLMETRTSKDWSLKQLDREVQRTVGHDGFSLGTLSERYRQKLSHQEIHARFLPVRLVRAPKSFSGEPIPLKLLHTLPLPVIISKFLNDKKMYL